MGRQESPRSRQKGPLKRAERPNKGKSYWGWAARVLLHPPLAAARSPLLLLSLIDRFGKLARKQTHFQILFLSSISSSSLVPGSIFQE